MKHTLIGGLLIFLFTITACSSEQGDTAHTDATSSATQKDTLPLIRPQERKHFDDAIVLTEGGTNAEAYFSHDGKKLIYQKAWAEQGIPCDQMFIMFLNDDGTPDTTYMLSNGKGKCTCGFFLPGDTLVIYSSTMAYDSTCPERVRRYKGKYVWQLDPNYEIFVATLDGKIVKQLTYNKYYDAEAVVSPLGNRILFTSTRDGDIDLYLMNLDGSNVKRLTHRKGYEGGAFFSPDGSMIVFRAYYPETEEEMKEYEELLAQNLVAPFKTEIFLMDTNGNIIRQVTDLGGANWAPYFHPSGKKIIFSSNHKAVQKGEKFPFNLYMINIDGTGLEQITYDSEFDAFPMFSPDGKWLVFESSRVSNSIRELHVILVKWKD
ncbi:MAG: hypothetical protein GXO48_07135 [Chlorobi bacterium]|nr:hypothetical protein [Chlorobiota bacterium]